MIHGQYVYDDGQQWKEAVGDGIFVIRYLHTEADCSGSVWGIIGGIFNWVEQGIRHNCWVKNTVIARVVLAENSSYLIQNWLTWFRLIDSELTHLIQNWQYYTRIPITPTLDFSKRLLIWTKSRFTWICLIKSNAAILPRFFPPIFVSGNRYSVFGISVFLVRWELHTWVHFNLISATVIKRLSAGLCYC